MLFNSILDKINLGGGIVDPKLFEALNKFMGEKKPKSIDEVNQLMQEFTLLYNSGKLNYEYSAKVEAYELLEKAKEAKSEKEEIKLVKKALEVDPDCVEAKIILAVNQDDFMMVYHDLEQALEEEKVRLQKLGFFAKENIGHFYGIFETREYIKAMNSLARIYANDGLIGKAIKLAKEILRLNENDNTGVRYLLMGLYAYMEDYSSMKKLYNKYSEENLFMLVPFMIYYFKQAKYDEAEKYLDRIKKVNKNFVSYFENMEDYDDDLPPYYSIGDISEVKTVSHELDFLFITMPNIENFIVEKGK